MSRRNRNADDEDNGFAAWGGYMAAKKAKLSEQFNSATSKLVQQQSDIFKGVSILVNGYTKPSADELKQLMAEHGGSYHLYQNQAGVTTHIIASNLPNVKINQLGNVPVVKPDWISESVIKGRLLDYSRYLLYTNQSRTQPRLNFSTLYKSDDKNLGTGAQSLRDASVSDKNEEQCNFNNSDVTKNDCNSNCVVNSAEVISESKYGQNKQSLTASDPKFLSEFYNNSRLHLISTLGAEFKQLVNDLREKSTGKFLGKEKLLLSCKNRSNKHSPGSTVIMHIDMDCFFVSVGLRQRPELRGKPVAVTHSRGGPSRSEVDRQAEIDLYMKRLPEGATPRLEQIDNHCSLSEIASCSYEARKCGIKNGMFLGSALKLCPDLIPIPYNFQGYRQVSSTLYTTIAGYTLDIEAVSCDEMYLDVTKILQETGLSVNEWATHIRSEITSMTGCPCSTGFGANRLQARLATRKAKPSGQYHLESDDVEEYMRDLPLADLPGVGRATLAKLNTLGLTTCGDVQRASLSMLLAEIGQKNGETIYEQAKGVDRKPLSFEHERKSVSAEINYGIRFKNHEESLTFIQSLANEVHVRLLDTKMKAKCITLKLMVRAPEAPKETAKFLGHGVCDSLSRSTTTGYAINDPKVIFREAKILYNRLNIVPEDLRGVGIQLSRLEKCATTSSALTKFLNQEPSVTRSNQSDSVVKNELTRSTDALQSVDLYAVNGDQQIEATQFVRPSSNDFNKGKEKPGKKVDSKNVTSVNSSSKDSKKTRAGKNQTSKALNNYFKSNKTQSQGKQVNNGISSSNIDLNVLKELPAELRNEIMKEYNIQDAHSINASPSTPQLETKAIAKEETSEHGPIVSEANDRMPKKKGFADLNHEQLKSLLRNWPRNEEIPRDLDINMLGDFFKGLAVDRMIERLFPLINFLHRNIAKMTCIWHEAYFKIINYVQEGMVARYGSTLLVPRGFPCSEHS